MMCTTILLMQAIRSCWNINIGTARILYYSFYEAENINKLAYDLSVRHQLFSIFLQDIVNNIENLRFVVDLEAHILLHKACIVENQIDVDVSLRLDQGFSGLKAITLCVWTAHKQPVFRFGKFFGADLAKRECIYGMIECFLSFLTTKRHSNILRYQSTLKWHARSALIVTRSGFVCCSWSFPSIIFTDFFLS